MLSKIAKMCQDCLRKQLTSLINISIEQSMFPDALKDAEETPVIKRNDNIKTTLHRSVYFLVYPKYLKEHIMSKWLNILVKLYPNS